MKQKMNQKKKKVEKCQRNQNQFFKKIIKIYTHLARLMKEKCEKTQITKNEREGIIYNLKRLLREYYKQFYDKFTNCMT